MSRVRQPRPAAATAAAVVLLLVAALAALMGMLGSWASGCCGSSQGSDSAPTLVGLLIAGSVGVPGLMLLWGVGGKWAVIGTTAIAPVTCVAAAAHSSDVALLAPFALAGWVGLTMIVTRARIAHWLHQDR